jgi:hypothetical protein
MRRFRSPHQRGLSRPGCALFIALLAAGCGDALGVGTTYPVSGRIALNGEPLATATTMILFKPDASRGNLSPFDPAGTLDAEGHYTVSTKGKAGAPPGWYRVIVTATTVEAGVPKGQRRARPHPKSLVPAKYGQAATTDLSVEVVESPAVGAYDLKLTR